jgi:hypothetical protein
MTTLKSTLCAAVAIVAAIGSPAVAETQQEKLYREFMAGSTFHSPACRSALASTASPPPENFAECMFAYVLMKGDAARARLSMRAFFDPKENCYAVLGRPVIEKPTLDEHLWAMMQESAGCAIEAARRETVSPGSQNFRIPVCGPARWQRDHLEPSCH